MPAKRKPTKVLKFTGAFAKNPKRGRDRVNEPKPNGDIGPPPIDLSKDELAVWQQITSEAPDGVLFRAHRRIVWAASLLGGRLRMGDTSPQTVSQFRLCLTELGMTPASSSRVAVLKDAEEKKSFAAI